MTDLPRFQELTGYRFSDEALLIQALTHTSFANERCKNGHGDSNQRLEFLGDSVLSTIISRYLYDEFPSLPEGKLSRFRAQLVCEKSLAEIAEKLKLGSFIRLGCGERRSGGAEKPSLLADCVEALIAAVYLDAGMETATSFVLDRLGFASIIAEQAELFGHADHKTDLQELFRTPDVQIEYEITGTAGPDHAPVFEAEVRLSRDGDLFCRGAGSGNSKKAAEQAAAYAALTQLRD